MDRQLWVLWVIFGLILLVIFIYSIWPNLWTRVLRQSLHRGPNELRRVALTFDDGPHPMYTPRLLDALKEHGARATFFVIAEKASSYPDVICRMLSEGHDVEVHGYTHALVPILSPRLTIKQFDESQLLLRNQFGIEPRFYRPTWGLCNLWTLLRLQGMQLVTWSIMVGDWRKTAVKTLLSRIVRRLHPGAILVLHDSDEAFGAEAGAPESVIDLIGPLIRELHARGYTIDSLRALILKASDR
jgi:peptidoglycan-N-acetylglucosamine deacetylase